MEQQQKSVSLESFLITTAHNQNVKKIQATIETRFAKVLEIAEKNKALNTDDKTIMAVIFEIDGVCVTVLDEKDKNAKLLAIKETRAFFNKLIELGVDIHIVRHRPETNPSTGKSLVDIYREELKDAGYKTMTDQVIFYCPKPDPKIDITIWKKEIYFILKNFYNINIVEAFDTLNITAEKK
jgi:hypothetical protein